MPDITMCDGTDCPLKEQCYRYTATSSEYQSYFIKPPFKKKKCDMFWDNEIKSKTNKPTKTTKK